jgi:UTP--glucose-1-phosphate uridylyltransferase
VKTTNELLLLRSDVYELDSASRVVSLIDHEEPFIDLSGEFRFIADFDARFPHGVPSIREARSLVVDGDVTFGRDVSCVGDVRVSAGGPRTIPDGARLEGDA